jgi:mycofactocin biosynthetic radical S-adenosylmethionine protein MftC
MRSVALTDEALRAPVNVTWEITEACNLSCRHCLSADLRAEQRGELTFAECRRIVDDLAAADVFQINFGGGEPFLRSDFLALLAYAEGKGITTCVSTNGTLLDDDLVERLAAMDGLFLQVSLDGAAAATNDSIRGAGTFARILAGVDCLRRHSVGDFSLNMVVTRVNVHEVGAFADLAARLGAKARLSRFRPSGAGCAAWDDYRLTGAQLLELSEFLGEHAEILTGDSFFSLAPESRRHLGLTMCGAARMTMAVAPDGRVYPCAFLTDPAFLAGNAAVESPVAIFLESEVFARLRANDSAACSGCSRISLCHGGCPAVAYFVAKSLDAGDPECLMSALAAGV